MAEEQAGTAVADAAGSTTGTVDAGTETMSRAEVAKIIADRDKLKDRVRDLTPLADAGKKALDAAKTTEERLAAIIAENETLKTQSTKAVAAMTSRLAREIEAIPEAMRTLVPAGLDAADQLEWIGQAHAAGVFGVKSASPGAQLHGGVGGATVTQAQVAAMSATARNKIYADVAAGKLSIVAA